MVEVSGSAKYLNDARKTVCTERFSLIYRCQTDFEELIIPSGRIHNDQSLDDGDMTHLITGVQYGGDAVFIFEREKSDAEDTERLEGSLHALIEKGLFKVQGDASINLKDFSNKKFEVRPT